jgi:hypothetical protein
LCGNDVVRKRMGPEEYTGTVALQWRSEMKAAARCRAPGAGRQ